MKTKPCCKEWQPNIDKINGFITLQAIRTSIPNIYTGKPFVYCPWCGSIITDEQTNKTI